VDIGFESNERDRGGVAGGSGYVDRADVIGGLVEEGSAGGF